MEWRQASAGYSVGGPVEEIRPGDVPWIPLGQKHWHGAGLVGPAKLRDLAIQATTALVSSGFRSS